MDSEELANFKHWKFLSIIFFKNDHGTNTQNDICWKLVIASYNTMMTINWGYSRSLKHVCVTPSSTDRWDCVHHLSLTLT